MTGTRPIDNAEAAAQELADRPDLPVVLARLLAILEIARPAAGTQLAIGYALGVHDAERCMHQDADECHLLAKACAKDHMRRAELDAKESAKTAEQHARQIHAMQSLSDLVLTDCSISPANAAGLVVNAMHAGRRAFVVTMPHEGA